MPMPTAAEIARYREDGAVCLRSAIPMEWIERMRAAVDEDMKSPGPMVRINTPKGSPGLFFVDFQLWQRHADARAFVYESPAREIAANVAEIASGPDAEFLAPLVRFARSELAQWE